MVCLRFETTYAALLMMMAGQQEAAADSNATSRSSTPHHFPSTWKQPGGSSSSRSGKRLEEKLERDRNNWLSRNGEKNVEEEIHRDLEKTEESLALLENLVHTDEELLDELNDRKIIEAVVTSMAQWNLRKLQKMQRRKNRSQVSIHRSRRDEAMVCYNELGCFRDEGPFNYLDLLPAPPEEINTRFFLYTPRNRDTAQTISYHNATSILASAYNASLPTKVMVHGFGSSCQRIWAKEMRTALISVVRFLSFLSQKNRFLKCLWSFRYAGRCQRDLRRLGERRQFAKLRPGGRQHAPGGPPGGPARQCHQQPDGLDQWRLSPHRLFIGGSCGRFRRIGSTKPQPHHWSATVSLF